MKKNVMERINDLNDIYSELKVNPSNDVIKIEGFDELETQTLRNIVEWMRVCKVANEGWLPKKGEKRHYPYYDVSSGFVFDDTGYDDASADTASASRLCLKNEKLAEDMGIKFLNVQKNIINV
jgi:hypothetical protein